MSKRKKLSVFTISVGILFLCFAIGLTVYNIYQQKRVEKESADILTKLEEAMPESEVEPLYKLYPDMEMPVSTIEGIEYIGVIEIEEINVKVPVAKDWSAKKLKKMTCRYYGSAYKNNMVIAAHNYDAHFGRLNELEVGSKVKFTDIDGNVFNYRVLGSEILMPTDVEKMTEEVCDLTLFTCTIGGRTRFTLRCELEE